MTTRPAAVIVLAAGEGTRMRSRTPKVLHTAAGRTLLHHVVAAGATLAPQHLVVVVGHAREQVTEHLAQVAPTATTAVQEQQHGTGHAVRTALATLPQLDGVVVVLPGDAPLLTAESLAALVDQHIADGAATTLLTAVLADPTGYGRVVRGDDGGVRAVVEHKDADAATLADREVATSVYAFDAAALRGALDRLTTDNAQGEEYLTDVVADHVASGRTVSAVRAADPDETAGVNDKLQLAAVRRSLNDRLVGAAMRAGADVVDPATTWLDVDVLVEADAVLLPGVQLLAGTVVRSGASVGPDCTLTATEVGPQARVVRAHCDHAVVGPGASVGPYAYLRPGAVLAAGSKVGTYVEVKNSSVGEGAKVPHLTYVGDAEIGEGTNIGAASVFVNYDGVAKHRTVVGAHARTGSDTMFVAPVTIGDGAYTAAGSVITEDVPPGAMAIARGRQRNITGWVASRRPGTPSAQAAERAQSRSGDQPSGGPSSGPQHEGGDPATGPQRGGDQEPGAGSGGGDVGRSG